MANCCSTAIRITCNSPAMADEFADKLSLWSKFPAMPRYKDAAWIGNLLTWAGLNPDKYECRGDLEWVDVSEAQVSIDTDDAWTPHIKAIDALCKTLLGDTYTLRYTAEEPGQGIFWTNDPDVEGSFIIDNWGGNPAITEVVGDEQYDASESLVRELLETLFPERKGEAITRLIQEFEASDYSDGCAIHQWYYQPIEDCP